MLYLDTSLLVAALTNETETERMQTWLGQQLGDELMISDWWWSSFHQPFRSSFGQDKSRPCTAPKYWRSSPG